MARNEFSVMKTRVIGELHDSNLSTVVGDFINETLDTINNETNHIFLRKNTSFSSVASQQEYTISSDIAADLSFFTAVTLRDPATYLTELSKETILTFDPDPTDHETDPWAYWTQGDTFGFYPIPGSVETFYVDYVKFGTDLSADSDTPDIPRRWIDLVVDGAVARGLKYLHPTNPQVWKTQQDDWFAKLRRMATKNQRKPNIRYRMKPVGSRPFAPVPPRIELWKT